MKYLLFILLLVVVMITAGCVGGTPTNITPTSTPTQNDTIAIITQQSQGTNTSTQKNSSTQNDCTPPRLKSGFTEFDQFVKQDSSSCMGTGAPVFTVPEYPDGPIVNDSVVGKFYWWSKLGYCKFRDDGIWILYAWDYQPHYYPGTWKKYGNTSYTSGQIYSYGVKIYRPNAVGQYYNESIRFNYDPKKDRLYLVSYDGIWYSEFTDAWIGRLR